MTVHLVGAGPGDPGLLTLRAAELLRRADVVVHDRLVSAAVLALANPSARRIDVGKRPGERRCTQERINAVLVTEGRAHPAGTVLRLKGGDPFVFGRGGEEALALAAAGVPHEVVPGVTSAVAAPAAVGVPVTHRHLSAGVTVVTAHQDPASDPVDWDAAARLGTTLVVLMGAARAAELSRRLMAAGMAPDTPVAVVTDATGTAQREWRGPLRALGAEPVASPATIVIGAVAALDVRATTAATALQPPTHPLTHEAA